MDTKTTLLVVFGAVVVIALLVGLSVMGMYNGLVNSDVTVDEKWAMVQTAYQRRADLIPQIVAVAQEYAEFEQGTLTAVTEARASIGKASTPTELQAAGGALDSALARLMVVVEAYPNLKANENFLQLQSQLEGTENRIKFERDNYNTAVKDYQVRTRQFPTNMIAGMFGFMPDKHEMFQATAGSEVAPDVKELFNRE